MWQLTNLLESKAEELRRSRSDTSLIQDRLSYIQKDINCIQNYLLNSKGLPNHTLVDQTSFWSGDDSFWSFESSDFGTTSPIEVVLSPRRWENRPFPGLALNLASDFAQIEPHPRPQQRCPNHERETPRFGR